MTDLVAQTFLADGNLQTQGHVRLSALIVTGSGTLTISGKRGGANKTWIAIPFVATVTVAVQIPHLGIICDGDQNINIGVALGGLTSVTIVYGA